MFLRPENSSFFGGEKVGPIIIEYHPSLWPSNLEPLNVSLFPFVNIINRFEMLLELKTLHHKVK